MNFRDYQKLAARTECVQAKSNLRMSRLDPQGLHAKSLSNENPILVPIRVTHSIIGMTGEVGEIAELFLHRRYGDHKQMILELGDLLWYMAEGLNALDMDMQEVYNCRTPMFQVTYNDIPDTLTSLCGRFASELQRWIFYGKYDPTDEYPNKIITLHDNLFKLYKDMMGIITLTLSYTGESIEKVCEANITKLKVRYPEKYSDWHAADENRNRDKEEQHVTSDVQKAAESAVPPPTKGDKLKCQYCDNLTADRIEWFKGSLDKPGTVTMPWCGKCDLKVALAKRGMTAPVHEGTDYRVHKHTE